MSGEVLLLTDDTDIAVKTIAVLESLEHEAIHLTCRQLADFSPTKASALTILVALDDKAAEKEALTIIRSKAAQLPVYLLQSDKEFFQAAPADADGSIRLPVRYGDLLEVLKQARVRQLQNTENLAASMNIIGDSPRIKALKKLIRQVAPTEANVLIAGESGTGKEVVARAIHDLSLRADRPFVAVNCGAIPPELLESELFGHEKGAFTGAFQSRAGRFELAEGGTLFLDEIGDMPLNMQVKLLRVIQERTFERVGGTRSLVSNVRLVAATHQDLEKYIDEGKFRLDLFYRLNVFPIELPPLRERSDDIPALINEFIKRRNNTLQQAISFAADALQTLMNHPLPGNVRELENLVERLSILYPGEEVSSEQLPARYREVLSGGAMGFQAGPQVTTAELPPIPAGTAQKINLKQYLASLERTLICRALEQSDWVVTRAARTLSVRRTTLIEKIRKLEIEPPRARDRRAAF
jgi:sigma-54 specific flagellar transcriptional regulator A